MSSELQQRLERDATAAIKARDDVRRDTLRFVLAAVHNEVVAKRADLDEAAVTDVLQKQAKMRRDSIDAFQKGGRADLVANEAAQLAVIEDYLPKQLDAMAIRAIARRVISETGAAGPKDMNKVMPKVVAETKGQADGRVVSGIVAELLKK